VCSGGINYSDGVCGNSKEHIPDRSPIVSAALAWWFSRQTRPEDLPCSSASSAFFAGSKIEIKNFSINSARSCQ